jgi:hypothetical protein
VALAFWACCCSAAATPEIELITAKASRESADKKNMKTNLLKLLCGVAVLGAAATASAQSTLHLSLSDAGSGRTTVSWLWTGDLASPGGAETTSNLSGIMGLGTPFPGFINNIGANLDFIPLSGFGTLSDLTHSASQQFQGLQFNPFGMTDTMVLWLGDSTPSTMLPVTGGDHLQYSAAVDSAIIDVPFSCFNPGTYQTISLGAAIAGPDAGPFTTDTTYNLTVGPSEVPEPSTLVLSLVGGLLLFRRRK